MAQIALDSKLYHDGWEMENCYYNIIDSLNESYYIIDIIMENNIPIGACILDKDLNCIQIFIHSEHRKKGFGLFFIESFLSEQNLKKSQVHAFVDEEGSDYFYRKCGIACFKEDLRLNSKHGDRFVRGKISYKQLLKIMVHEKLNEYENYSLINDSLNDSNTMNIPVFEMED